MYIRNQETKLFPNNVLVENKFGRKWFTPYIHPLELFLVSQEIGEQETHPSKYI